MKVLLGLIIGIAVVTFLMYQMGGVESFDPHQQYLDAQKALKPGMTWQQVLSTVKAPKKYRRILKESRTVDGETYDTFEPSPLIKFDEQQFAARFPDGALDHGFIFEYCFSASDGLIVEFDGSTRQVIMVRDMITINDLLYPGG